MESCKTGMKQWVLTNDLNDSSKLECRALQEASDLVTVLKLCSYNKPVCNCNRNLYISLQDHTNQKCDVCVILYDVESHLKLEFSQLANDEYKKMVELKQLSNGTDLK